LFIAMGIDELSMNVGSVLEIKDLVRHLNKKECLQALNDVLKLSTAVDIKGYLQDLIQ
jgi:phosphoenolpyruvate-protein kinase (PTS system EI component)